MMEAVYDSAHSNGQGSQSQLEPGIVIIVYDIGRGRSNKMTRWPTKYPNLACRFILYYLMLGSIYSIILYRHHT